MLSTQLCYVGNLGPELRGSKQTPAGTSSSPLPPTGLAAIPGDSASNEQAGGNESADASASPTRRARSQASCDGSQGIYDVVSFSFL
ncbi:hypothetical protein DY000_02044453 [Brassica cretica]|uniref:Uncharacterized protein n=1 Tax=Brassica cretica TaxID=69181 RepID=A0ABQ7EYB6_BRACR|nr:hypothetical protein DY000_02044453 [Brassica cretica]